MTIQLPEHVAERTANLGEPLAQFASSRIQTVLYLVFGVGAIALGMGALVFLVVKLAAPRGDGVVPIRLVVLGPFLVLAGLGMLVKWKNLLGSSVVAFENGLARLSGRECEIMRWDRIRLIRRGKPLGDNEFTITRSSRLSFVDDEGREWVFTETLAGLKELRSLAEERTLPYMLPVALDHLLGGRTLMFGDIGAKEEGLTYPRRPLLAWDHVAQAGVDGGVVYVTSLFIKDLYCRANVYDVPNAHLLLTLVEQFRQG